MINHPSPRLRVINHPSPRLRVTNHPSPRLRVTSPTPRRAGRDTPRPESTHANRVCAGPGIHPRKQGLRGARGRWALVRSCYVVYAPQCGHLEQATPAQPPTKNCIFVGPGIAPPLRRGELVVFSLRAEFPSVWKLYSAGAFYFWVKKSPGWGIIFLMTKIMTKAIRCPSSRISNWPDEPESYPVYFYQFDAPTMPAPIRL